MKWRFKRNLWGLMFLPIMIIFVFMIFASCKVSKPLSLNSVQYTQEQLETDNMLLLAQTYAETGNTSEAEKLYEQVLQRDGKNALAYSKLGLLYFSQQNLEKAITNAKKAVSFSPDNIWYRLQLGQMYYVMNDFETAAVVYEDIIHRKPDRIELYQTLTEIYHIAGNGDKMLATLNRMENRWGISEEVSMAKYAVFNILGKKNKAEEEILKLSKQYPDDSKYHSMLAELAMQEKDYPKAYSYYKAIEKNNPDNPLIQIALANYYLEQKNKTLCYEYLMRAMKNTGLDSQTKLNIVISVYGEGVDTNREDFERFFALLQEISKVNNDDGRIWALLATGYLRNAEFENAVSACQKAISLGEKDYEIYQNLLFAKTTLTEDEANSDSIIAIADIILELYPEQPLPYLFKGVNLMFKASYPQAIATLQQGRRLALGNNEMLVDFYANLAEVYHKQEIHDSSDIYFEKTIVLDSNQYMAMNNYAYYLSLRKTNLDRAEALARKVVMKFPDNHIYVDTYAWVLYLKERYPEAKAEMDKVIKFKQNWSKTEIDHYQAILKALNISE